jgi:hypothetical protein
LKDRKKRGHHLFIRFRSRGLQLRLTIVESRREGSKGRKKLRPVAIPWCWMR